MLQNQKLYWQHMKDQLLRNISACESALKPHFCLTVMWFKVCDMFTSFRHRTVNLSDAHVEKNL